MPLASLTLTLLIAAFPQDGAPKFGLRLDPRRSMEAWLGKDGLGRFDRAVQWILNRQEEDGSWPAAPEDEVSGTSLALLVLMAGGLDVPQEKMEKARDRAFAFLESRTDSGVTAQEHPGPAVPVQRQALATWALMEGGLVLKRSGDAAPRATRELLASRLDSGAFPEVVGGTEADDEASALATLVLVLAVDGKYLDSKEVKPSTDWLRARALERSKGPFQEGACTTVASSILSSLFLGSKAKEVSPLSAWLEEHPPLAESSLLDIALGMHAAHQLGKPIWNRWSEAFVPLLKDRFETSGKEKGAAKAKDATQRSHGTFWLVLTMQVGSRWKPVLAKGY